MAKPGPVAVVNESCSIELLVTLLMDDRDDKLGAWSYPQYTPRTSLFKV